MKSPAATAAPVRPESRPGGKGRTPAVSGDGPHEGGGQHDHNLATGDLRLDSIRRDGEGRLLVSFTVASVSGDADCRPADVETFAKFRRFLTGRGFFARHEAERGGRRGREAWNDELQQAWQCEPLAAEEKQKATP